jgi:hypothetical protein
VEGACIGKNNCGFTVTKEMFGVTLAEMSTNSAMNCNNIARLAVQVTC